jgi:pimeloyl-ACP methyl ester carboxylesterase
MTDEHHTQTIRTNGIDLSVTRAGLEGGPPVILLHGFPEGRLCWKHQVGPLADAGLDVFVPAQRGYETSDKPPDVKSYALDPLADDVLGLIDATGRPKVSLVGHDWGGIVAWWTAIRHPDRVERLAILNAPHPVALRHYIRKHPGQLLKSWYVFMMQIPRLPEAMVRRQGWRPMMDGLQKASRPGTFGEADFDEYRKVWSEPGAIVAMIGWYRAALQHRPADPADPRVHVPTLILWGTDDRFMQRGAAEASLAYCDDGRLEWFEGASHWLQHEEPDRVNRLLIDFLQP